MAVPVNGMIIVWKARATMSRQAKQETSISTQFVEDDIKQYNELASMFANRRLTVKSKTDLQT